MSIRILFFATLADITGRRQVEVEASECSNVASVFSRMAQAFPLLESHRASTMSAVNSEFARPEAAVHDGDEVAFFPPVSGG